MIIKQITKQEIKKLVDRKPDLCLSIYMPVYKAGSEVKQNPTRLKNLMSKAVDRLNANGLSSSEAKKMLGPADDLLQSELFSQNQSDSFAAFVSREIFECYGFNFSMPESVVVSSHFYLKPLLSILSENNEFSVLALSKKHVRFLHCDGFTYQELELQGIPKDLKAANRFNDPERVLQLHTQTPHIPGARSAAIFHGHGVGVDDEKDYLTEYFRQIDKGIHSFLRDKISPLVLAGVDYFHPMYKKISSYPHLYEDGISGNVDLLTNQELYTRAREIVTPYLEKPLKQALARYDELAGTHRVSRNIEEVLEAANAGRIWNLFVQCGVTWWGKYKDETAEVISHDLAESGDEEIANLTAIYTIQNGGSVFLIDKDSSKPAVFAVFRY